MKMQAFDHHVGGTQMDKQDVCKVDELDRLMATSDVVVICLPLNDGTKGLISGKRLALMKPDAFLINVSRGSILG